MGDENTKSYQSQHHEEKLKEIERYDYYTTHGDIIIVTTLPDELAASSVHGTIIITPTTEDANGLLKQVNDHRYQMQLLRDKTG